MKMPWNMFSSISFSYLAFVPVMKKILDSTDQPKTAKTSGGRAGAAHTPPAYGLPVADSTVAIQRKKKDDERGKKKPVQRKAKEEDPKKKRPVQRKKKSDEELKKPKPIQRKARPGGSPLLIDAPDSPLEKEADTIAEQVVQRFSAPSSGNTVQSHTPISITSAAASSTGALQAPPYVASELEALRGQGQSLPGHLRPEMEAVIGTDFGGVRLHTDARAAELSEAVHAQAFTYGQDVYFNQGMYQPGTAEGRRLLGHELGHVGQTVKYENVDLFRNPLKNASSKDLKKLHVFIVVDKTPELSDISKASRAAAETAKNLAISKSGFIKGRDSAFIEKIDTIESFIDFFKELYALCYNNDFVIQQMEIFSHGGADGPFFKGKKQFGIDKSPDINCLPKLIYSTDAEVFFRGCRTGENDFLEKFGESQNVTTKGFIGRTAFFNTPPEKNSIELPEDLWGSNSENAYQEEYLRLRIGKKDYGSIKLCENFMGIICIDTLKIPERSYIPELLTLCQSCSGYQISIQSFSKEYIQSQINNITDYLYILPSNLNHPIVKYFSQCRDILESKLDKINLNELVNETPNTNIDLANWIIKAMNLGVVNLLTAPKYDIQKIANTKDKTKETFFALNTLFTSLKRLIKDWIESSSSENRPKITINSIIRSEGLHSQGNAIDFSLNNINIDNVISIISELPVGRYEIGLPFEGAYFPPNYFIENVQKSNTVDKSQPVKVLQKFKTGIYTINYDNNKKIWNEPINIDGRAYTLLSNNNLKNKINEMINNGYQLEVFPDNGGHVHLAKE
ncbi:MAG: DUF4157 domain-containing protein [Saprospiraceae bacterium]|nr:DUF4157 domain-containing protein [Saprospiraceae bacterium]